MRDFSLSFKEAVDGILHFSSEGTPWHYYIEFFGRTASKTSRQRTIPTIARLSRQNLLYAPIVNRPTCHLDDIFSSGKMPFRYTMNDDFPEQSDLTGQRRAKLTRLKNRGYNPYTNHAKSSHECGSIRTLVEEGKLDEGACVSVAGRISAIRKMGASCFLDLRDFTGRVQIFLGVKTLSDAERFVFEQLDLGDILEVEGDVFRTKTGEVSVKARTLKIVSKSLQPPPAKFYGLADTEMRYRQRYLDLIANQDSCDVFVKRSQIVRSIREFFYERGFLEVETPMMQSIAGGASAQPFMTHHNALGIPLYMRIAPELYLKRLLVGGFTKIFEIGRNFRNEGISRRHNPEFTMLEAYQAYGNCESMMQFVEDLVCYVARKVLGTYIIEFRNNNGEVTRRIDLSPGWPKIEYRTLIQRTIGEDWFSLDVSEMRQRAREHNILVEDLADPIEVTNAIFEKLVEPSLINPTFVVRLPRELVPLAKGAPDDPSVVDVFECCANGQEISPGYSEQNDPIEQRERLEDQAGAETQRIDEEFLTALEHGMPPAGGIGIGIDRLCMLLLAQESIRDVILFPQMRPKSI